MKFAPTLLLTVVLAACVSTRSELLGSTAYSPIPDDQPVLVFEALGDVDKPYEKVALVHAEGSPMASWEKVLARLKGEARSVGANALILREEEHVVRAVDRDGQVHHRKVKSALALRLATNLD